MHLKLISKLVEKGSGLALIALVGFSLLIPSTYSLHALTPQGYVSDFANILSANERANLEASLKQHEASTGQELAVVTVESLEGQTIEGYAVELFEEWRIGKADQDNGVLLLVAPNEREVRIEVGYGLEPILTDAASYWIIQNQILPAFRDNNYFAGISAGVEQIGQVVSGEALPEMTGADSDQAVGSFFDFLPLIFFLPMFLISLLARSKSWWGGGILGAVAGLLLWRLLSASVIWTPLLVIGGLLFDFLVSRAYRQSKSAGRQPPWWAGGSGFGHRGGGGGFGGFGGGSSGGGGASGRW